jgi:CubicO group peptidase (beta-lactamase class C family)
VSSSTVTCPSEADLRGVLEQLIAETAVPGIAIELSVGAKRVAAQAGVAAVDGAHALSECSRFQTACLMKFLASLLVLELHAEGILDVERPIDEYLPELRLSLGAHKVCLRHLLGHTSGYQGLDISDSQVKWNYSWARFLEHLERRGQLFTPGRVFNYEHSEHVILGEILRRLCDKPAAELIGERIFGPLGIASRSTSAAVRDGDPRVGQHVYSTSLARFVPDTMPALSAFWASSVPNTTVSLHELVSVGEALLAASREPELRGPFTAATMAAIQQPLIALPPQVSSGVRSEQLPCSFSVVCGQFRGGILGHNGSTIGQTTALRIDPSRAVVVAVGVNAWSPVARDGAVSRALALLSGGWTDASVQPVEPLTFEIARALGGFSVQDITGSYRGSYFGEVHVSAEPDAIHFDLGPRGPRRQRVSARREADGCYSLVSRLPLRLGFFPDPDHAGAPALMMGVHAYKRS